jgi:ankyrin repeat protein
MVRMLLAVWPENARDAQNASGNTALHWACLNGHKECVKLLCLAGCGTEVRISLCVTV